MCERVRFPIEKGKIQVHLSVCPLLELSTKDGFVFPVALSGAGWLKHTWWVSVCPGSSALAGERRQRKGRKQSSLDGVQGKTSRLKV